jgi:hypothetical protein
MMVNWDVDDLRVAFEDVGLVVEVEEERRLPNAYYTRLNRALVCDYFCNK